MVSTTIAISAIITVITAITTITLSILTSSSRTISSNISTDYLHDDYYSSNLLSILTAIARHRYIGLVEHQGLVVWPPIHAHATPKWTQFFKTVLLKGAHGRFWACLGRAGLWL